VIITTIGEIKQRVGDISGLISETRSIYMINDRDYIVVHYSIGVGSGVGHLGTLIVFSYMHGHEMYVMNEKELSKMKLVAAEW
jgi:hypothetical protein